MKRNVLKAAVDKVKQVSSLKSRQCSPIWAESTNYGLELISRAVDIRTTDTDSMDMTASSLRSTVSLLGKRDSPILYSNVSAASDLSPMVWGAIVGMGIIQIVGMVWYSRYFLGGFWMRANFPGKTMAKIDEIVQNNNHIAFPITLTAYATIVMMLSYIVGKYLELKTMESAIKVGIGLWVIVTVVDVPHCIFAQRSFVGFVIDHLFDAVVILTISICLMYFG